MTTKSISITSKNQITLPIEYVRKMKLEKNRVLSVHLRGNTIVLTPQPMLLHGMKKFWGKHNSQRVLTDKDIKRAIRTSAANKIMKNL